MLSYKIANLTISIDGVNNKFFEYRMKKYQIDHCSKYDITIKHKDFCDDIIIPPGRIVANINQRYWMELENDGFAFFDHIPPHPYNFSLITADNSWSYIDIKLCSPHLIYLQEDNRPYYLLGEIMKFIALKHNGIAIHSSSISYDNNGILFSAPSGTGKSTHTQLWKNLFPEKTIILNDDMPIIRFNNNVPCIFGTPWSGKTEINCNESAPLKAIIFLQQAPKCSIKKINGHEAIWRLFNETRKPAVEEMMEQSLDMLDKILNLVPTYLLECDISDYAVELAKSVIE